MTTRRESRLEEPGRIVATGGRCRECGASMLRREVRPGFRWVCTNLKCGATENDKSPQCGAQHCRARHCRAQHRSRRFRQTKSHQELPRV